MFLAIDPRNGIAIYEQIVRQTSFAVAGGVLAAGDFVPSVRELARELAINPNTVAKAYRDLQADGVLESVRGMGLAVSQGAQARCRQQRTRLVRERIRQVLREANQSRLSADVLRGMVNEELQLVLRDSENPAATEEGDE